MKNIFAAFGSQFKYESSSKIFAYYVANILFFQFNIKTRFSLPVYVSVACLSGFSDKGEISNTLKYFYHIHMNKISTSIESVVYSNTKIVFLRLLWWYDGKLHMVVSPSSILAKLYPSDVLEEAVKRPNKILFTNKD